MAMSGAVDEPFATYAERAHLRCGHGIITETMLQHARTSQKPHHTIKVNHRRGGSAA